MNKYVPLVMAALLFSVFSSFVHASNLIFEGTAKDLDSGALIYIERHEIALGEDAEYLQGKVTYSTETRQIASKHLDYSLSQELPILEFVDERNEQRLYVAPETPAAKSLLFKETFPGKEDTSRIAVKRRSVVDAGFERLTSASWDRLIKGDTIKFDFLALSRASMVKFELDLVKQDEQSYWLEISPSIFLIGLLIDPIRLRYYKEKRRLREYWGVTNTAVSEGDKVPDDNYHAHISYRYLDE